jgi:hypothetical protein
MVAKRKLTIETLSKLGRRRLAELLIAEAVGNRQLTQTLNFAISAEEGPAALGTSLRKRLATLAKSRSMLSYDNGRELIGELDGPRTTIVEIIGPQESRLAFELLWEFIDLHPSILERVDDSSGRVGTVFRTACDDLGPLAQRASIDPDALAATVFEKVTMRFPGIRQIPAILRGRTGRLPVSAGRKDRSEAVWGLPSLAAENRFLERGQGAARDSVRMRQRPVSMQEFRADWDTMWSCKGRRSWSGTAWFWKRRDGSGVAFGAQVHCRPRPFCGYSACSVKRRRRGQRINIAGAGLNWTGMYL